MSIGERLKIARNAIGYTLERAAEQSGIGVSSISEFEHSKREPKFSQLSKLAEIFQRNIEFFLTDEPIVEDIMLWRAKPTDDEESKKVEAKFRRCCQQYHNLEVLMGKTKKRVLPQPDVTEREDFSYAQVNSLAERTQADFRLGNIPSLSLQQTLEEKFYVKIFHLNFSGSAISVKSSELGPAILLNKSNKQWRRNFDLAHELFHLLTWDIFRKDSPCTSEPSDTEEKFANAFASRLLLPAEVVKDKIDAIKNEDQYVHLEALDEIAREFCVSLKALLWRMLYLYDIPVENIEKIIEKAEAMKIIRPSRKSDDPDELPERFCSLAIKALREGKLSLMQFAKYMGISYRKAQEYLREGEDFKDEKVSISTT